MIGEFLRKRSSEKATQEPEGALIELNTFCEPETHDALLGRLAQASHGKLECRTTSVHGTDLTFEFTPSGEQPQLTEGEPLTSEQIDEQIVNVVKDRQVALNGK